MYQVLLCKQRLSILLLIYPPTLPPSSSSPFPQGLHPHRGLKTSPSQISFSLPLRLPPLEIPREAPQRLQGYHPRGTEGNNKEVTRIPPPRYRGKLSAVVDAYVPKPYGKSKETVLHPLRDRSTVSLSRII